MDDMEYWVKNKKKEAQLYSLILEKTVETDKVNYFKFEHIMPILAANRKKLVSIEITKADGSHRELCGILCFNESRNNYLISEGTPDEPEFKNFAISRVKRIITQDGIWKPKENK